MGGLTTLCLGPWAAVACWALCISRSVETYSLTLCLAPPPPHPLPVALRGCQIHNKEYSILSATQKWGTRNKIHPKKILCLWDVSLAFAPNLLQTLILQT